MRIVAGLAKGRKLAVPTGRAVRPTSDRVREAVFSALGEAVDGARVLDLFAGTGALGLEALSRGAAQAVFVESGRPALVALQRNIEATGCGDRSRVISGDALAALARLAREGAEFDLVFLDPPYASDLLARSLELVVSAELLASGAHVVTEHAPGREPESIAGLQIIAAKRYGDTSITQLGAPVPAGRRPDEAKK
jgi:16S rRNA (guanine(966)-N(2))-methyltransferase RsmD